MNKELIFFNIIPRHAIWGGTRIQDYFGYPVPKQTGQVWAFSAQENGETISQNGEFQGAGLNTLWHDHPELFHSSKKDFPFIISLLAPVGNLSVQVHPTDHIAQTLGYAHGKNEAWVLLDTDADSNLVYGSKVPITELIERLHQHEFQDTFNTVPTKKGDFIYIPAGTIHGLGKGNIAYEVQQSTDLTFRIYDYDRTEDNGHPRQLNIEEAENSIQDADPDFNTSLNYIHPQGTDLVRNRQVLVHEYIHNGAFTITSIRVAGTVTLKKQSYWLATVSQGGGKINGIRVQFADNFIVPATQNIVTLEGNFTLMITSEIHTVISD